MKPCIPRQNGTQTLPGVILEHLLPCAYFSALSLAVIAEIYETFQPLAVRDMQEYAVIAAANGLFMGLMVHLYHFRQRLRYIRKRSRLIAPPPRGRHHTAAILTGAGTGSGILFIILSPWATLGFTLVVLILSGLRVNRFLVRLVRMFRPDCRPTWLDITDLVRTYEAILFSFTMVNLSLELLHRMLGQPDPFGLGKGVEAVITAFYFTVVVMTTLGFGDIAPQSMDAKLIVSAECLMGYLILALIIGVITRGVVPLEEMPYEPEE